MLRERESQLHQQSDKLAWYAENQQLLSDSQATLDQAHARIKQLVPEYKTTIEAFAGKRDGLSISAPLALAVPALFAVTWVAFAVWILLRSAPAQPVDGVTVERVALVVLAGAVGWLLYRVRRLEHAPRLSK